MRRFLVLLLLAGCTAPPPTATPAAGTERDRQARFACDARGRMTAATPAFFAGPSGQAGGMLAQQSAGNDAARLCWERYRATGVLPPS